MILDAMADGTGMSEATLCTLVDVVRQTRGTWCKAKLLRGRTGDGYTMRDALETAACKLSLNALGPSDGKDAWRQVQADFPEHVLAQPLDLVFDATDHRAVLVTAADDLARAVRTAHVVRVIPLDAELRRVRDAVSRWQAARAAELAARNSDDGPDAARRQDGHAG
jgi:hypothetical protein